MNINLSSDMQELLREYSKLLNKDYNEIINDALLEYFKNIELNIIKDEIEKERQQTNLSYEEFWDGFE